MIAKNVSREILEAAAEEIGVRIKNISALNMKGTRWRVSLQPGEWKDEDGDRKYQRISPSTGRRVYAVCWHGFRDFFRACFRQAPDAVFQTALNTWRGSEDFELRYRDSGHRNVGSMMAPCSAAEACVCPESGYAQ